MKTGRFFGLAVMVLFAGIILALGINYILNNFVSHPLEETPASPSLDPGRIESSKMIADEKLKLEGEGERDRKEVKTIKDTAKEKIESKEPNNENAHPVKEAPSSEESTIVFSAPATLDNTMGPSVDSQKITKELPVFRTFTNYSGPSAQDPASAAENTEGPHQDITPFIPSESRGGPPIDPKRTYKELPPFTPVTNKTGPIVTDKDK